MAQDPRGAWAAMPRPHRRPRRRPPPGTGKAQPLGSPASSEPLCETEFVWRGKDACARTPVASGAQRSSPSALRRLLASRDPPRLCALSSSQCPPLLVAGAPRLGAPRRPPQPHHILQQQLQRQKGRVSVGGGDRSQTVGARPQIGIGKDGEFRVMPQAPRSSGSEDGGRPGSLEGPV